MIIPTLWKDKWVTIMLPFILFYIYIKFFYWHYLQKMIFVMCRNKQKGKRGTSR